MLRFNLPKFALLSSHSYALIEVLLPFHIVVLLLKSQVPRMSSTLLFIEHLLSGIFSEDGNRAAAGCRGIQGI
jgi:hypothetical protein